MKFDSLRATWRTWLLGTLIALLGVILVRLVAPHTTGKTQAILSALGRLTSFSGLIIIIFGINRRIKRDSEDNTPPH